MNTVSVKCIKCKEPFDRPIQRGRPAIKCPKCRSEAANETIRIGGTEAATIQKSNPIEAFKQVFEADQKLIQKPIIPEKKIEVPTEPIIPKTFRVSVTNLGLAYDGNNEMEAFSKFNEYCKKSNAGFGQVGHELVKLLKYNKENGYEEVQSFVPDFSK